MVLFRAEHRLVVLGLAGSPTSASGSVRAAERSRALTALSRTCCGLRVLLVVEGRPAAGECAGRRRRCSPLRWGSPAWPTRTTRQYPGRPRPGPGAVALDEWVLPVASYWLRMAVAPQSFWVQFSVAWHAWLANVPSLAWKPLGLERNAASRLAVGLAGLTGWIFDLTVLLVPVTGRGADREARRWPLASSSCQAPGNHPVNCRELSLPGLFWVAPAG